MRPVRLWHQALGFQPSMRGRRFQHGHLSHEFFRSISGSTNGDDFFDEKFEDSVFLPQCRLPPRRRGSRVRRTAQSPPARPQHILIGELAHTASHAPDARDDSSRRPRPRLVWPRSRGGSSRVERHLDEVLAPALRRQPDRSSRREHLEAEPSATSAAAKVWKVGTARSARNPRRPWPRRLLARAAPQRRSSPLDHRSQRRRTSAYSIPSGYLITQLPLRAPSSQLPAFSLSAPAPRLPRGTGLKPADVARCLERASLHGALPWSRVAFRPAGAGSWKPISFLRLCGSPSTLPAPAVVAAREAALAQQAADRHGAPGIAPDRSGM